ncbi:hypothetical protein CFIMG_007379RA00001 [Ceratocystis fimbriata CBS 114723]|uniref:Uncharacterized protein n=1 Tax=Ceratocystis fimbriata CBS 114723 TaxID=1035309 RepID=A0A2C5WXX5_9PEZI|nr:hypothetical protein CFIMG_007379RA00001 [Ceratocystis fimbriata CBS 114723]
MGSSCANPLSLGAEGIVLSTTSTPNAVNANIEHYLRMVKNSKVRKTRRTAAAKVAHDDDDESSENGFLSGADPNEKWDSGPENEPGPSEREGGVGYGNSGHDSNTSNMDVDEQCSSNFTSTADIFPLCDRIAQVTAALKTINTSHKQLTVAISRITDPKRGDKKAYEEAQKRRRALENVRDIWQDELNCLVEKRDKGQYVKNYIREQRLQGILYHDQTAATRFTVSDIFNIPDPKRSEPPPPGTKNHYRTLEDAIKAMKWEVPVSEHYMMESKLRTRHQTCGGTLSQKGPARVLADHVASVLEHMRVNKLDRPDLSRLKDKSEFLITKYCIENNELPPAVTSFCNTWGLSDLMMVVRGARSIYDTESTIFLRHLNASPDGQRFLAFHTSDREGMPSDLVDNAPLVYMNSKRPWPIDQMPRDQESYEAVLTLESQNIKAIMDPETASDMAHEAIQLRKLGPCPYDAQVITDTGGLLPSTEHRDKVLKNKRAEAKWSGGAGPQVKKSRI